MEGKTQSLMKNKIASFGFAVIKYQTRKWDTWKKLFPSPQKQYFLFYIMTYTLNVLMWFDLYLWTPKMNKNTDL